MRLLRLCPILRRKQIGNKINVLRRFTWFQQGRILTCHGIVIFVHNWRGGATNAALVKPFFTEFAYVAELNIFQRFDQHANQRRVSIRRDAMTQIRDVAVLRIEPGERFRQLAANGRLVGGQE